MIESVRMFPECKLFRDVAAQRNMSRAAAKNGISQSAASQQVRELERRLGAELLDRRTRPLGLTGAGKLYLDLCRDVVRRTEEFEAALESMRQAEATGELRIASIYSVGLTEMAGLREEFERICPGVELRVEYLRPDRVYESVRGEAADLGLVSYPEPSRDLAVIPWREEKMAVAVWPDHRFGDRAQLSPKDLDGEDFVAFDADLRIRKELDRFLREQGAQVHVTLHFDNIQMIKEAVALGHGISILPERTMRAELEQERLRSVRLDEPGLSRPVGVVHRKRWPFNRATLGFLEALRGRDAGALSR